LRKIGFNVAIIASHCFAAYEAPSWFTFCTWNGGWKSKFVVAILALVVVLQYYAKYFLGSIIISW
jgi:hypothetical protein